MYALDMLLTERETDMASIGGKDMMPVWNEFVGIGLRLHLRSVVISYYPDEDGTEVHVVP